MFDGLLLGLGKEMMCEGLGEEMYEGLLLGLGEEMYDGLLLCLGEEMYEGLIVGLGKEMMFGLGEEMYEGLILGLGEEMYDGHPPLSWRRMVPVIIGNTQWENQCLRVLRH